MPSSNEMVDILQTTFWNMIFSIPLFEMSLNVVSKDQNKTETGPESQVYLLRHTSDHPLSGDENKQF